MEKQIVWADIAQKDFWNIILFLQENWEAKVLDNFFHRLQLKIQLLEKQPYIGFKSSKHSRFRQTLISKNYKLIYTIRKNQIIILRLKHSKLK